MKAHFQLDTSDPIQKKSSYLYADDLDALRNETGIEPTSIIQRVGKVVFIPGCMPHQVMCKKC